MVEIVKDAISQSEIDSLIDWFEGTHSNILPEDRGYYRTKGSWPDEKDFPSILNDIIPRIIPYEYEFERPIWATESIDFAVRLHVDNSKKELEKWGNVILIPLRVQGEAQTVFFDNHWYHTHGEFFTKQSSIKKHSSMIKDINGDWHLVQDLRAISLQWNKKSDHVTVNGVVFEKNDTLKKMLDARLQMDYTEGNVSDYEELTNYKRDQSFDQATWQRYLKHVPLEDLHGLTLSKVIDWKPGDIYRFERSELHCSGSNHAKKTGITIWLDRK